MLLEKLKEDTRPLHDQVEETMESRLILNKDFSITQYVQLLQRLKAAHDALEPAILDFEGISSHPQLEAKHRLSKRHALVMDLFLLNGKGEAKIAKSTFQNEQQAWGAMYVLEGSTLGGAMIHKHLQSLGWDTPAFNFYSYYGKETGSKWKTFKQVITALSNQSALLYNDVLEGSRMAYSKFMEAARAYPSL